MLPEIGNFALALALAAAILQGIVPMVGAQRGDLQWISLARPLAWAQFLLIALAYAILTHAFLTDDFSVLYTANNSNSLLPLIYKISAVWGGHEGSLLLWVLFLSLWGVLVAVFSKSLPNVLVARTLAVMGLVAVGFLLFTILTSNPFDRLFPAALDGRDLNPLLQDPGLVIHPPMLYLGYVGFVVPFALVVAALIGGQLDATWARWSRPWTTVAWMFLTVGIAIGSWWAYAELGWGGWWFWDPVENASFMPWLLGTALIHSLAVTEKRGAFRSWTVLLAIFTFSLSLLGTFLVRSGVLVSVHAFATDPSRGVFILMFISVVVGSSLLLYAARTHKMESGGQFSWFSRETLLLGNNLLLTVAMLTVLLGTLYPIILDALGLGKISVGPPYFNAVFVPLMLPLVFLIGVGASSRWKSDQPGRILQRYGIIFALAMIAGVALPWVVYGDNGITLALAVGFGLWVILSSLQDLARKLRQSGTLNLSNLGMHVAHIGTGMLVLGVAFTSAFSIERDLRMDPGSKVALGDYQFALQGFEEVKGPNYTSTTGTVHVYDLNDNKIAILYPEKRVYTVQTMPMTEAAVDTGLFRDLYVAMGDPVPGTDGWAMRVYYKPFVLWIWLGPLVMAIGGLLALLDPRYRKLAKRARTALQEDNLVAESVTARPAPAMSRSTS
jgi:cytochrome c-type biogenesis protein CcmF